MFLLSNRKDESVVYAEKNIPDSHIKMICIVAIVAILCFSAITAVFLAGFYGLIAIGIISLLLFVIYEF